MKIDIIIPSCKPYSDLRQFVALIKENDAEKFNYIPTGFPVAAGVNRNIGLRQAKGEYIIMIDDDIGGFFPGWQRELIAPLEQYQSIKMVSARLLNPFGQLADAQGCLPDMKKDFVQTPKFIKVENYSFAAVLSAAIAFRREDVTALRYNNHFLGSGFEDTYFCYQLSRRFNDCRMGCNNKCKLIHYHDMKNQNTNNEYNKSLMERLISIDLAKGKK